MTSSRQPPRGDRSLQRPSGAGRGASAARPQSARSRRRSGTPPLATPSSLPLFPADAGVSPASEPESRAPLGVRRLTPAPARPGRAPAGRGSPRPAPEETGGRASSERASAPRAARVASRCGAAIFDLLIIVAVNLTVLVLTLRLAGLDVGSVAQLPLVPLTLFLLLLDASYVVLLTAVGGQTFGKMLFGLRVVDAGGQMVPMLTAAYRMIGGALSLATLGLGWLWMAFDREGRTLHDRLTGTQVRPVSVRTGRAA